MIFMSTGSGNTARSWLALSGIAVAWAICWRGSGRLVLQGLASSLELTVEGEGACRAELSRVVSGINRRGRGACLMGFRDVGPGIIRRRRERASDRPRNNPSGEKERYGRDWWSWPRNDPSRAKSARRTCPGMIRRGRKERFGRDWWRWPRNDPSGAKSVSVGTGGIYPGIIRRGTGLVAYVGGGEFAVYDTLAEGDAPSSP